VEAHFLTLTNATVA